MSEFDQEDCCYEYKKELLAEIDRLTKALMLEEQRNAARLGVNDRLTKERDELKEYLNAIEIAFQGLDDPVAALDRQIRAWKIIKKSLERKARLNE